MAKRVNSFSELFQAGPSESQIFEDLAEIVPPSVLQNLEASTPIVPEPQPEAPVQEPEPLAQPEAGPQEEIQAVEAKAGPASRTSFTDDQLVAMEEFVETHFRPSKAHREELSSQIGLDEQQIYYWIQRYYKKNGIQTAEQVLNNLLLRNEELTRRNKELEMKNQLLNNSLYSGLCPKCGGPVPPSDVQRSLKEVAPHHPEPLPVSPDDSIDQFQLREDVLSLIATTIQHPSSQMPSESRGLTHDLVGVPSNQIIDIVTKAKDEFLLMATVGYPLWISSPNPSISVHPEILHQSEYLQVFQPSRRAPYFKSEASRHSATIHLNPTTIVQILMDVGQWLPVFCSMLTNAHTLEVLSSGEEGSYKEQKQVMSAEFLVPTHLVSTREVQFIRYSHQQLDGSWIVADISVDELRSTPRPSVRSICRKKPSGCLIRDMQNGSSFVTWVEHVEVREKDLSPIFESFVQSGFGFGARRWIAALQRQADRFLCSMGINTSPNDTIISAEGRRGLTTMANKMVASFFNDICNSSYHHWNWVSKTRDTRIEVKTNKRRDDPTKPSGLNRTAGCTVNHTSHHTRVFDFLRDVQNRPLWDSTATDKTIQVFVHMSTGPDPRNSISVFKISDHNDFLILQECCTDATGSFVIYAPIDELTFQSMMCGADLEPTSLMPFGFSILPDITGGILDRTLLTIVFQISVKYISTGKAVDLAVEAIRDRITRIKAAVN